jgi:hypothetical protein
MTDEIAQMIFAYGVETKYRVKAYWID